MPSGKNFFYFASTRLLSSFLFLLILFFSSTCKPLKRRSFLPHIAGYDEAHKVETILDDKLIEVSGINYLKDGLIAANNDEDGRIFFIHMPQGNVDIVKFAGKADYEDIVKVDSFFYILESKGNLHRVQAEDVSTYHEFKFHKKKKIEFESLYYDKKANKLVLISKDHSEGSQGILAYTFDLASETFSDTPYYFISMRKIFLALKNNIAECKPSAAAVHPITGKVFMIASVGKVILETTTDGKVEHAYKINPAQFPQPEGITFAPNGDMYISNEGVHGKATLLMFPYKK